MVITSLQNNSNGVNSPKILFDIIQPKPDNPYKKQEPIQNSRMLVPYRIEVKEFLRSKYIDNSQGRGLLGQLHMANFFRCTPHHYP